MEGLIVLVIFAILVLVIVAILTWLTAMLYREHGQPRPDLLRLTTIMALGIPAQAVIGGITVLTKLNPFVVALHLLISFALVPLLGRNFFPSVDAGQILLHVRAPVGVRVEKTAQIFADVEASIRQIIPI